MEIRENFNAKERERKGDSIEGKEKESFNAREREKKGDLVKGKDKENFNVKERKREIWHNFNAREKERGGLGNGMRETHPQDALQQRGERERWRERERGEHTPRDVL
jgi:hypothetical protein